MQSARNCSASSPHRRAPRRASRAAANSRPDIGHHRDVVGPAAGERVDGTTFCDAVAVSVDATLIGRPFGMIHSLAFAGSDTQDFDASVSIKPVWQGSELNTPFSMPF
jgi:hypothetical protein